MPWAGCSQAFCPWCYATMIIIAAGQINRKDISLRYQTFYGKHAGNDLGGSDSFPGMAADGEGIS